MFAEADDVADSERLLKGFDRKKATLEIGKRTGGKQRRIGEIGAAERDGAEHIRTIAIPEEAIIGEDEIMRDGSSEEAAVQGGLIAEHRVQGECGRCGRRRIASKIIRQRIGRNSRGAIIGLT